MNAEPLVLLPGMGCTAALWSLVNLGSGPVLTPVLDQRSIEGQVDKLLDELPDRFALAGLSLGGIVATALVRRAPERVTRLVLLSTNPYAPTPAQHAAWADQRQALAVGTSAQELQRRLLPVLLSPQVVRDRPDLVELTLTMAADTGEESYDAQLRMQATRIDECPGLRDVGCPTTIISARHDQLCSVAKHQEMAALIPGARLSVLEDCAHLSPLEQPETLLRSLSLSKGPEPVEGHPAP